MVEIDVLRCPDGTPVVFRDNRLDAGDDSPGITDGTGVVWETPRQEVLAARVLDTRETVPSLEEALAVLSPKVGGGTSNSRIPARSMCVRERRWKGAK